MAAEIFGIRRISVLCAYNFFCKLYVFLVLDLTFLVFALWKRGLQECLCGGGLS